MSRKSYRPLSFSLLHVLASAAAALAQTEPLPEPHYPARVPPSLSQWELSVAGIQGGPNNIHPVRVWSDGRLESVWLNTPGRGLYITSRMSPQDCATLFKGVREAINRMTFDKPLTGHFTWDAPLLEVRLSSGSRAIRLLFDIEAPREMDFDIPLAQGFEVLKRVRSFPVPHRFPQEPRRADPEEAAAAAGAGSPDWMNVDLEMVSKTQSFRITVYNPRDNPKDRYERGERESRSGMDLVIAQGKPGEAPMPRAVALSDAERAQFLEDVRTIVNQFELHDPKPGEAASELRCVVGIHGWKRQMDVEFQVNDALPQEWRTRIARMADLAHEKDGRIPSSRLLLGGQAPEVAAPENPPGDR